MRSFSTRITDAIEHGIRQIVTLGDVNSLNLVPGQVTACKLVETLANVNDPVSPGQWGEQKLYLDAVPLDNTSLLASVVANCVGGTSQTPQWYQLRGSYNGYAFIYKDCFYLTASETVSGSLVHFDGVDVQSYKAKAKIPQSVAGVTSPYTVSHLAKFMSGMFIVDTTGATTDLPYTYDYGSSANIPDIFKSQDTLRKNGITAFDLIKHAAQISGVFMMPAPAYTVDNPSNKLTFIRYNSTATPHILDSAKIISLSCAKADKIVKRVTVVDTDGACYQRGVISEANWRPNYVEIVISNNPFVTSGLATQIRDNLRDAWFDFTYTPYRLTMPQDPRIELGDKIQFTDYEGNTRTSYVAEISRQFNGAMTLAMGM